MWVSGTKIVRLQDDQGNVLDSRSVSENPPSVHIIFPNGNETITSGNSYTIAWSAADLDGDTLTYAILIRNGANSMAVPIATNLNQTTFEYSFSDVQERARD